MVHHLLHRIPEALVETLLVLWIEVHQDEVPDLITLAECESGGVEAFKNPLRFIVGLEVEFHHLESADSIPHVIAGQGGSLESVEEVPIVRREPRRLNELRFRSEQSLVR